ncbi:MAG TPA: M56 family metallopeptidase [Pyrinomonadaceae bacterium]|nr:M56 family metallopeptidase [Pyrinomonadaceae bacterium]
MTYYLLVTCLALLAFMSLNAAGSLIATALWSGLSRRTRRWTANARARTLFWLCILPPACALLFVAALMIPAYFAHEPYPAPDQIGLPLIALALFSASGVALALYRAASSWVTTWRLTTFWLRQAERVSVKGITIPAYRLSNSTPVLAVVGTLRPRLFIAAQVMDSLSAEEMEVALAHERAHLLARDTLKRALMHVCRDLLPFIGAGRVLERAWALEAERAADEYAAHSGTSGALDLAAALIKIARLMPAGVNNVVPAGAFLLEGADDGVAGRVRRLTEMASTRERPARRELLFSKVALPVVVGFSVALLATMADGQVLLTVHALTERVVKLLA